jgi:ectoine hydroxylase-related dioxygenase (phytanoyl-CoA dioxygenase family)
MARGTHLRQEPLAIPKWQVDPSDVEVDDLQLDAGGALVFEIRIFHTAAPNLSDRLSKDSMLRRRYPSVGFTGLGGQTRGPSKDRIVDGVGVNAISRGLPSTGPLTVP